MRIRLFQENGTLSIFPFYIIFIKHILSVLKISKTFVLFFKKSGEYVRRYGQGSVFKIRFEDPF